ncbi:hypothetical protein [Streptomyces sp. HD]|uniref:hypothetical protein n=1 Tax=Streptomyces sp. HD TaxID=3020892 RepID=UPI00232B8387|nr:hypothetical protein [Streptomyces sp. HD]MDC0768323.1 hypothetical protein [Streptomyces sp. HD]
MTSSNPETVAGTDFSIFVVVRNPFDVPITLHEVQTHIPVELMDVNRLRLLRAAQPPRPGGLVPSVRSWRAWRRLVRQQNNGVATAVGTEFSPESSASAIETSIRIGGGVGDGATVAGVQFNFPDNPSPEELDQLFRRLLEYRRGVTPVTLQPGNSVVRQFVLRTRSWLFFRPLAHTFEIQVSFSLDGADQTTTVAHDVLINAPLPATVTGGMFGSVVGTTLRVLGTSPTPGGATLFRGIFTGILASLVVVVAFARKSSAQPFVAIEDFWGGAIIGFSVGYFGFQGFADLLKPPD